MLHYVVTPAGIILRQPKNTMNQKYMKFESGVTFRFPGGSEQLYVAPIKAEIDALEKFVLDVESLAADGVTVTLAETPKSKYLPLLGKRRWQAAGATGTHGVDVFGKSEMEAQWAALTLRLYAVSRNYGSDN